jgi:sugar O-acyltransferase (sialic acid O-acetyltransferase NeuD family)
MGAKKVIIFGNGQIAEVAATYIQEDQNVEIEAFTVEKQFINKKNFLNYPLIPFEELINIYNPENYYLFAPISYKEMNSHRERIYKKGKSLGYKFYSFVHKNCINYALNIGENCFILENNVIQPFSYIGNNCIIWSGNHIGHHTTIASHTFISSHVVISGSVKIGESSFLGVNSTIIDNIKIGEFSLVGAGTLITRDLPPKSVVIGKSSKRNEKINSLKVKL